MNKKIIDSYKKAWEILKVATPQNKNCGILCDRACCKGEKDQGMYLFPGEELLYKDIKKPWFRIIDTEIDINSTYKLKLFVCNESCERELRPLSCRIFPLLPYIEENCNDVGLVHDLRIANKCPLVYDADNNKIEIEFFDKVLLAIDEIIDLEYVEDFIILLSEEYDYIAENWLKGLEK